MVTFFEWKWKSWVSKLLQNITGRSISCFCISLFMSYLTKHNRKQLRENKSEVKVVLRQRMQILDCWVSKQDDSKSLDVIFSPLLWNEMSAEKHARLQSVSLATNLTAVMESGSIPAFSTQTCKLAFSGPDLFLCSICFLVIGMAPKLWEGIKTASGTSKGGSCCSVSC